VKVIYFSHAGNPTGLGYAASDYVKSLGRINGMELESAPLAAAVDADVLGVDVVLYHGMPAQLAELAPQIEARRGKVKQVGVTVWETSRLPSQYAKPLGLLDAVIVPSSFCQEIFAGALTAKHTSVHRVPHCFDPMAWPVHDRPQGDRFTFYTIGGWGERKNVLGVLRAYLHEFSREDKVRLVVLSNGVRFDVIESVLARSGIPLGEMPAMFIPDGSFSQEEIVRLHQDSDCFVSATRGEGWGLGMFEALVMQRPVVAPAYGGQREFLPIMTQLSPRSVPYHLTPVWAGEGEFDSATKMGKLTLPRGANARQLWAEPDLSVLAHRMRDVYELFKDDRDYSDYEDYRMDLEDRYSTPVVGQNFYRVLKDL
jgi:hypothetical protein